MGFAGVERRMAVAILLGFVCLAGAAVQTMAFERTELRDGTHLTRKILEGNETVVGEDFKPAYITPCFPPHLHHPRGLLWPTHHLSKCENGTVCTQFDSTRCGLMKECKEYLAHSCTEFGTVVGHYGYPQRVCLNATTETVKRCREFKVCTLYACLPPKSNETDTGKEDEVTETVVAEPPEEEGDEETAPAPGPAEDGEDDVKPAPAPAPAPVPAPVPSPTTATATASAVSTGGTATATATSGL